MRENFIRVLVCKFVVGIAIMAMNTRRAVLADNLAQGVLTQGNEHAGKIVFRAVATIRRLAVVPYLPIAIELFRYPLYAERFE